ncbi:ABC transporter permease [Nocardioides sp. InS609-2]|uniref:ABC transporter permease n=1 Tax=Nocardioides sp. InS609-2 TaxID=2760705 RepID=UPI0020BFAD78|nr:ABC transporter permease [Nocardioides sp. InS609-2]
MSIPGAGEVMATHTEDSVVEDATAPREPMAGRSPMRIALGRLRKDTVAMVCFGIVMIFVLIAIFAGTLADLFNVDLTVGNPADQLDFLGDGMPLKGPPNHGFDPEHPFGVSPNTANDNLAYWLYGCRTSLLIATTSTVLATIIGVVLGLVAGFTGGVVDKVVSFITDLFLTLPFLLIALITAPIINSRFNDQPDLYSTLQKWSLVGILVFFGWMGVCRLVRGETISLREREFIQASRVIGMPTRRILFKELLPNLVSPIVVSVSLLLPAFIALEAGLAFLGVGITQGASWGQTILLASKYFEKYPLYLWEPLLGIVVLTVSLNLLGDAIRDAVDPKTRR